MPLPNTWVTGQTFTAADADAVADAVNAATVAVAAAYTKPVTGIPKTDLAAAVQTSLGLADTALQSGAVVVNSLGSLGSTYTLTSGNATGVAFGTLTANTVITLPTPVAGGQFTLVLKQDATGGRTPTFGGATVNYPAGTPNWVITANAFNVLEFLAWDTGAWYVFPSTSGTNDITGNAATATKLLTARNINGVAFDGTANITVADGTKEPSITATTSADYYRGDKTFVALNKAAVGLGSVDNTADVAKNVLSAAKLTTARTINGVAFDGTANITAPTPGQWGAADQNFIAWSFDPAALSSTQIPTSGTVTVVGLKVPAGTITNIILNISTAGATLTSGQCFAGLYQGGTLLAATADQAASWVSTGVKTIALTSPQTVTAGMVYVAYFSNGTTNPAFSRGNNTTAVNAGLGAGAYRYATADTGRTTTFASTLGTLTSLNAAVWAAVS